MSIALIAPPVLADEETERVEFLGIGYLGAVARQAGYRVDLIDCRYQGLDHRSAVDAISRLSPRIVAMTAPFTLDLVSAGKLATMLRAEGYDGLIVVGGHPSAFGYRAVLREFPAIDVVVIGEGELTFLDLVRAADRPQDWDQIPGIAYRQDGEVRVTPCRSLIADLDTIPFPARDNIVTGGLPASVVWFKQQGLIPGTAIASARGCPFNCTYCGVIAFYGASRGSKWRARSAGNVVEEIGQLAEQGVGSFRFVDDNFFGSCRKGRERAVEMAELIIKRGIDAKLTIECCAQDVDRDLFALLRRAGLVKANIGIESGVSRSLDSYDKHASVQDNERAIDTLRDLGIEIHPNFILIDPETTVEELRENVTFMKRTRLYRAPGAFKILYSNRLALFEGTPMLRMLHEQNRTRPWKFSGIAESDQAIVDRLGAVFDYSLKDPRVADFLRLHRPVILELFERERLVGRWQASLRARANARETAESLLRWRSNIGTVAFQTFVRAVEMISAGCSGEDEIRRGQEELLGELDRYDRLHFGKSAAQASEEGLRGASGAQQQHQQQQQVVQASLRSRGAPLPAVAPTGAGADPGISFTASPVVEVVLEVMLQRDGAGPAGELERIHALSLWNVLNMVVRETSVEGAIALVEDLRAAPAAEAARVLGIRGAGESGHDLSDRIESLARWLRGRWEGSLERRWRAEVEPLRRAQVERTHALMEEYWRGGGLVLRDLEEWTGYRFSRRFDARVILSVPGARRAFGFDSQSLQPAVSDIIVICPPAMDDSAGYAPNVALALYHEALHPLVRESLRQPGVASLLAELSKDESYLNAWKTDGAGYAWEPWLEEVVVETFLCYLLVARGCVSRDSMQRQLLGSSRASNRFMMKLYESLLHHYRPRSRALGEFLVQIPEMTVGR